MHHSHASIRPVRETIDTVEELDLGNMRFEVYSALLRDFIGAGRRGVTEKQALDSLRSALERWLVNQDIADDVTVTVIIDLYEHMRPVALACAEATKEMMGKGDIW